MPETKLYGCCDDPSCPYCHGSGIVEICQICCQYVEDCKCCLDKNQSKGKKDE
jgi:hypothetical protein